jgi:hypothetical protein
MSTSKVATQRDIDESQELQDKGIKKEFRNVHEKIDKRFDEQRLYMDKRFELAEERFQEQFQEQRSYVDDRFTEVYAYMDDRFQQVDDRFQQVDDRFQQVDDRFQQVDDRFQQVDDRFQDLEVLIKNSRATNGWHDIYPVRVQDPLAEPRNRYQTPPSFPNKVVKFWRLQRPRHQRQLVELLRFYGIRASDITRTFEDDDDDTESESSLESQSQSTLEEAVKADPALALARLAAPLGLDYYSINHNMGLYEQVRIARAQQEAQRAKREQSEEDKKGKDVARPTKKAAISEVIQARRSGPGIPLEALIADPEPVYESPPVQSHVSWAGGTWPKEGSLPSRASASSSKKTAIPPSPPSQPLGGSTVSFTHTPSVVKDAGRAASSKHSQTSEETSV